MGTVMNKALLMNVLYKPNIGGVENSIFEISKELIKKGYSVDILCSDRNNEDNSDLEKSSTMDSVNIYRYNYNYGKLSFVVNILNSRKLIKNLAEKEPYSLVISRSYFLVISGVLSGLKNIKYIPPEVSYYSKKGTKTPLSIKEYSSTSFKLFMQWLALISSKNVFVFSESMFNQVKGISLSKVLPFIINPGVNLERFSIANLEEKEKLKSIYNIPRDKNIILALGRFSEIKQFDLAIKAMTLLSNDYVLVLVGSGPELKNYENIIDKNNLERKVIIFSSTNKPEIFYKLADVFLMTSRYESFGQTILEACVSGLQIVSFNRKSGVNTNIELMLADCKGVHFVDEQSIVALAQAIEKTSLYDQSSHSIFFHNQNILKKRYSWGRFLSIIENYQ